MLARESLRPGPVFGRSGQCCRNRCQAQQGGGRGMTGSQEVAQKRTRDPCCSACQSNHSFHLPEREGDKGGPCAQLLWPGGVPGELTSISPSLSGQRSTKPTHLPTRKGRPRGSPGMERRADYQADKQASAWAGRQATGSSLSYCLCLIFSFQPLPAVSHVC